MSNGRIVKPTPKQPPEREPAYDVIQATSIPELRAAVEAKGALGFVPSAGFQVMPWLGEEPDPATGGKVEVSGLMYFQPMIRVKAVPALTQVPPGTRLREH